MEETEVIEATIAEDMVLGTTIGRLALPAPEVDAVPAHPTGSGSYSLGASEVASVFSAHPADDCCYMSLCPLCLLRDQL